MSRKSKALSISASSSTSNPTKSRGNGRHGSAGLTLNGQVMHEPFLALGMVEDLLKRRVLQGGPVDIPRHPVVVEHRGTLRGVGDEGKK